MNNSIAATPQKKIRTRFAPSPTGYMHIGNLRTALYEYLIARHEGGSFIIRIEDTDQDRYVEGAVEIIFSTLKMAGIKHDEGPDKGGEFGPYIQSERKPIYMEYANKLIASGNAYRCFCSKERLAADREKQEKEGKAYRYDRHCFNLSAQEAERLLKSGIPYVVRQKMPDQGSTSFEDVVYGIITVENSELEDQILIKSDGLPTYNFANVVDDHLMEITHVVRGNEYLSSSPKYNLLYQAFGWEIPVYVHVPLIIKPDGKKMSKRNGDPSFEDLIEMGYLTDAVVNFVVLLGWSPGDTQEIFSLEQLEQAFSINGISKSPAVFDIQKLNWMNGEYIRKLTLEEFHNMAVEYYDKSIKRNGLNLLKLSEILQPRVNVLSEISDAVGFINELPDYDISIYKHKKMKTDREISLKSLLEAKKLLSDISAENFRFDILHDALLSLALKLEIKNGQMLWPVRTAITGKEVSPGGAIEILDILGKEESLARIEKGIEKLQKE